MPHGRDDAGGPLPLAGIATEALGLGRKPRGNAVRRLALVIASIVATLPVLAGGGTLVRRQPSQALELLGEKSLLAEEPHAHFVQSGKTRRRIHVCERLLDDRVERIRHGFRPRGWPWLSLRWP